jgi:transposase InsO family protein
VVNKDENEGAVRRSYTGRIQYTEKGKYSRDGGPTLMYDSGSEYWIKDGKKHREDGPAQIDGGGNEWWFKNNELHREDGPAVTLWDGKQYYCYRGVTFRTKKEWSKAIEKYRKKRGQKKRCWL